MRKFNVTLNISKLEVLKAQLTGITAQLSQLQEKAKEVQDRYNNKTLEIQVLESTINSHLEPVKSS